MTDAREEALECVPYIHYPVWFKKDAEKTPVQALIDSGSEVNAIHLSFAKQLGLPIRSTDVGAQKIDGTTLDIHGIVVAAFLMVDKANQVKFFEVTFLMANVSPEVVLGMAFLTLSGADDDFSGQELWWKTYTTKKALSTTRRIELVGKKEFAAATLNPEHRNYVIYVASLSSTLLPFLNIYPSRRPQISGLIAEKAFTKVPAKYSDFANVFSPDLTFELSEHRNQRSCYQASEGLTTTLWTYLQSRASGIEDFKGLHWDQSSQWVHQTVQVSRRCSHPIQLKIKWFSSVVRQLPRPQQPHNQEPVPVTTDWRVVGQVRKN